jgi:hypothetical protein
MHGGKEEIPLQGEIRKNTIKVVNKPTYLRT